MYSWRRCKGGAMKTFKWLIMCEFWEHKTGFLWAPVGVGVLVVLLILLWSIAKLLFGLEGNLIVNGQSLDLVSLLTTESHGLPSELFLHAYFALWLLEFGLLAIVTYTYCLGALFDDRKDRSILFWKSMPISDIQVILSKIGMALIIGPLI